MSTSQSASCQALSGTRNGPQKPDSWGMLPPTWLGAAIREALDSTEAKATSV